MEPLSTVLAEIAELEKKSLENSTNMSSAIMETNNNREMKRLAKEELAKGAKRSKNESQGVKALKKASIQGMKSLTSLWGSKPKK